MNAIIRFFKSSIGRKWVVALTGLVLIGYVVGHLIGNLQIFIGANQDGPKQINAYAHFLHSMGPALYVIRTFLVACLFLHVGLTITLARENRAARPQKYAVNNSRQISLATKTMVFGGLTVFFFIIYHLLHFTMRKTPGFDAEGVLPVMTGGEYDCYNMVINQFQNPVISGVYILGLFMLAMHLSHGFQSVVQTLGLTSRKWICVLETGSKALAWLIFLGYISIPVASLAGILKPVADVLKH
jgi:succinate dehydrogenase / fumarate reductase cytochrome b subunit